MIKFKVIETRTKIKEVDIKKAAVNATYPVRHPLKTLSAIDDRSGKPRRLSSIGINKALKSLSSMADVFQFVTGANLGVVNRVSSQIDNIHKLLKGEKVDFKNSTGGDNSKNVLKQIANLDRTRFNTSSSWKNAGIDNIKIFKIMYPRITPPTIQPSDTSKIIPSDSLTYEEVKKLVHTLVQNNTI